LKDHSRSGAPKRQLRLAKYFSLFVRKYRQTYPHLCTHLRRQSRRSLYLNLNLDLYLNLNPSLYRVLFVKSCQSLFRRLFALLCGSLYESKFEQL